MHLKQYVIVMLVSITEGCKNFSNYPDSNKGSNFEGSPGTSEIVEVPNNNRYLSKKSIEVRSQGSKRHARTTDTPKSEIKKVLGNREPESNVVMGSNYNYVAPPSPNEYINDQENFKNICTSKVPHDSGEEKNAFLDHKCEPRKKTTDVSILDHLFKSVTHQKKSQELHTVYSKLPKQEKLEKLATILEIMEKKNVIVRQESAFYKLKKFRSEAAELPISVTTEVPCKDNGIASSENNKDHVLEPALKIIISEMKLLNNRNGTMVKILNNLQNRHNLESKRKIFNNLKKIFNTPLEVNRPANTHDCEGVPGDIPQFSKSFVILNNYEPSVNDFIMSKENQLHKEYKNNRDMFDVVSELFENVPESDHTDPKCNLSFEVDDNEKCTEDF